MKKRPTLYSVPRIALPLLLLAGPVTGQDILTHSYNNARTGANLKETILTPSNVDKKSFPKQEKIFGKIYSYPVEGSIFAQPLYLSKYNGKEVNAVYTVTMGNWVYAFNADPEPSIDNLLWKKGPKDLGNPAQLQDPCIGYSHYKDIPVEAGILGTPVIGLIGKEKFLYFIAISEKTLKVGKEYTYTIYKLDAVTGDIKAKNAFATSECVGGDLQATPKTLGTNVTVKDFQVNHQGQRPGLLLFQNPVPEAGATWRYRVYAAFASFNDRSPFHGWILGFDADTLEEIKTPEGQNKRFNVTPNGGGGGIWMSAQGIAADDESLYVITGNGYYKTGTDLSESFVRLSPDLDVLDWFTPCNVFCLNAADLDLGTAGAMLLPDDLYKPSKLIVGGGKEGKVYLLNRNRLGKLARDDGQIPQSFCAGDNCGSCGSPRGGPSGDLAAKMPSCSPPGTEPSMNYALRGTPIFWESLVPPSSPLGNPKPVAHIYLWPQSNILKSYEFDPRTGKFTPAAFGASLSYPVVYPGGILALSANGLTDGIVWASTVLGTRSANQAVVPGVLRAYRATPAITDGSDDTNQTLEELWNSNDDFYDQLGNFAKFPPPVVANGKVYVATQGEKFELQHPPNPAHLVVFGLKKKPVLKTQSVSIRFQYKGVSAAQIYDLIRDFERSRYVWKPQSVLLTGGDLQGSTDLHTTRTLIFAPQASTEEQLVSADAGRVVYKKVDAQPGQSYQSTMSTATDESGMATLTCTAVFAPPSDAQGKEYIGFYKVAAKNIAAYFPNAVVVGEVEEPPG